MADLDPGFGGEMGVGWVLTDGEREMVGEDGKLRVEVVGGIARGVSW